VTSFFSFVFSCSSCFNWPHAPKAAERPYYPPIHLDCLPLFAGEWMIASIVVLSKVSRLTVNRAKSAVEHRRWRSTVNNGKWKCFGQKRPTLRPTRPPGKIASRLISLRNSWQGHAIGALHQFHLFSMTWGRVYLPA
jgi:hypothetical protein